ncbi:Lacal_2735 family protein [Marinomonas agarivorans]|nr:Lacal_2735 family protein [Marinomonas agarivorans]
MFSFLKSDPTKKLSKEYDHLLEQAMQAQRNGNIMLYSELTAQAEAVRLQLEELEESVKQ